GAEPEQVRRQIEEMIGLDASHAILTSAKEGIGTADVLEAIVRDIPPPRGDPDAPATALIFDSWFDPYHGAVVLVRVFDGQLAKGRRIRMMATGKEFLVTRVGVLAPRAVEGTALAAAVLIRCGFRGLLQREIVQERLERESQLALITPAPTVAYRVVKGSGEAVVIDSPPKLPPPLQVDHIEEPYIRASIHLPVEFLGNVLALCEERRGRQTELRYHGETRVQLGYELPLSDLAMDLYDTRRSAARRHASVDSES